MHSTTCRRPSCVPPRAPLVIRAFEGALAAAGPRVAGLLMAGALLVAGGILLMPADAEAQQHAEGTLVVVNKGVNTVTIVDLASGAVRATLPTGEGPHEVAITSDGSRAVVTDYAGGNSLTVVDVTGLRVGRTIPLDGHPRPHGIAMLPDDAHVAVTSEASAHVVIVRIADGEIVSEIPTGHPGSHMLAMVADGRTIYTSNGGDGTVSELDVASASHTGTVPVAPRLEAIGVTPDGEEVWVGSNEEGTVSVVDTGSGNVETPLSGFGWPYRVLFTPDRRLVILPDLANHELRIVDRASREELARLEFPGAGPQGVTLTDDASALFLSLSREARVVVIDLETFEVVRSIDVGETPDGVAYTPRTVPPGDR